MALTIDHDNRGALENSIKSCWIYIRSASDTYSTRIRPLENWLSNKCQRKNHTTAQVYFLLFLFFYFFLSSFFFRYKFYFILIFFLPFWVYFLHVKKAKKYILWTGHHHQRLDLQHLKANGFYLFYFLFYFLLLTLYVHSGSVFFYFFLTSFTCPSSPSFSILYFNEKTFYFSPQE